MNREMAIKLKIISENFRRKRNSSDPGGWGGGEDEEIFLEMS
jgi:hypothetical protein